MHRIQFPSPGASLLGTAFKVLQRSLMLESRMHIEQDITYLASSRQNQNSIPLIETKQDKP